MSDQTPEQGFMLSNKLYDKFKFMVRVILPALAVLYASLSEFWGFPKVQEVVGSISALALFLGVLLGMSSKNFTPASQTPDGAFVVTTLPDGKKSVQLEFEQDPATLVDGRKLSFEVKETNPQGEPDEEVRDENSA